MTSSSSADMSAGIEMGLYLAARLTDETSVRRVQLSLDYDPAPPFAKLNYDDLGMWLRLRRAAGKIPAPLVTAAPRRLTRAEVGSSSVTER